MHQYHAQIFAEIRSKQNIFLLNGPSIEELKDKIHDLKEQNVIYWGVNNIEGIENNILSKIGKNISIYYIESLEECNARIDDIIEFLERDENNLLITGVNFIHNTPALKCYLPKNVHKILIIEQFVTGSRAICNSCGSMLNLFLNIVSFEKKIKPIFLFGMDGMPSPNITDQDSHAFMDTYKDKLPRDNVQVQHFGDLKNHKQTIYDDMVYFDEKTMPHFKESNKRVFLNKQFEIYNASENSFYKSLPKISQKDAINLIQKNDSQDCGKIKYYKPDLDETYDIYNKIIDFTKHHYALERLYIENSIQIKDLEELLRINIEREKNSLKGLLKRILSKFRLR